MNETSMVFITRYANNGKSAWGASYEEDLISGVQIREAGPEGDLIAARNEINAAAQVSGLHQLDWVTDDPKLLRAANQASLNIRPWKQTPEEKTAMRAALNAAMTQLGYAPWEIEHEINLRLMNSLNIKPHPQWQVLPSTPSTNHPGVQVGVAFNGPNDWAAVIQQNQMQHPVRGQSRNATELLAELLRPSSRLPMKVWGLSSERAAQLAAHLGIPDWEELIGEGQSPLYVAAQQLANKPFSAASPHLTSPDAKVAAPTSPPKAPRIRLNPHTVGPPTSVNFNALPPALQSRIGVDLEPSDLRRCAQLRWGHCQLIVPVNDTQLQELQLAPSNTELLIRQSDQLTLTLTPGSWTLQGVTHIETQENT